MFALGTAAMVASGMSLVTHRGSCHCGAVRFEADAPADLELHECNCSICQRVGYLHLTVNRQQFRLLAGEEQLTTYTFNTGVAKHTFCSVCGVKPFYVPRSHPDGYRRERTAASNPEPSAAAR